jgi:hypothetical protein
MSIGRHLTLCASLLVAPAAAFAQPLDTEERPPSSVEVTPRPVRPVRKLSPLATTERWGGGIRLTGLSGIGALPGVNFGGEVAGLVRRDEVFVEIALATWRPEDTYYVLTPEQSVALKLDVWTVRAGWASMDKPLRAWLLGEVGEVAGTPGMTQMSGVVSRMVMGDTPSERRWAAVGAGLGVAWPLSQQARVVGNFELAIPVSHDELPLDRGEAYKPDPLAARYAIGVEVGWR